jgi:hypothetical protein
VIVLNRGKAGNSVSGICPIARGSSIGYGEGIRSAVPDRPMPETQIFQGRIIIPRLDTHARFLFPLVRVQKTFRAFYNFFLKLIWNELIYNRKNENEFFSLVLFVAFWILTLLLYRFRPYLSIFILVFSSLWYIDYYRAKKQYLQDRYSESVILQKDEDDNITWSARIERRKLLKSDFIAGKVSAITIARKIIYGGAFQGRLGRVWQIQLRFWDGSDLAIDEVRDLFPSFQKAVKLSRYFGVNLYFMASQGYGDYSEEILEIKQGIESLSVRKEAKKDKIRLMTKWHWRNTRSLLGQIFHDSGFLLFVVLITNLMANLGQVLDAILTAMNQRGEETIIYLPDIFKGVTHDYTPVHFVNLSLATSLMIYRGWRLSRAKHITIDKYELKYAIDNHRIDRLKTAGIRSILLLQEPALAIAIIGSEKAIVLEEFQRVEDCLALMTEIQKAIERFQPSERTSEPMSDRQ